MLRARVPSHAYSVPPELSGSNKGIALPQLLARHSLVEMIEEDSIGGNAAARECNLLGIA